MLPACGEDDGEGEAYGYGCVDGVAAVLEDFDAGVGGVVVDADDHGVAGAHGRCGWNRITGLRCRLRESAGCKERQDSSGEEFAAKC